jgi:hypothetical protein
VPEVGQFLLPGVGVLAGDQGEPTLLVVSIVLFRLCVNGKMSLKVLQEYIVRRSKQGTVRPALLFEVRGRIQNPGENIGRLSEKCSEEDGFLYIFVRS